MSIQHPDIAKERSTMMQMEDTCNRLIAENDRLKKALKDVTECSEVVLANAHWEVSYGSGDLRNALKRAKQALSEPEQ